MPWPLPLPQPAHPGLARLAGVTATASVIMAPLARGATGAGWATTGAGGATGLAGASWAVPRPAPAKNAVSDKACLSFMGPPLTGFQTYREAGGAAAAAPNLPPGPVLRDVARFRVLPGLRSKPVVPE